MFNSILAITGDLLAELIAGALVVLLASLRGLLAKYIGAQRSALIVQSFAEAMQRAVVEAVNADPTGSADAAAERAASYMQELKSDAVEELGAARADLVRRAKAEMAALGITPRG